MRLDYNFKIFFYLYDIKLEFLFAQLLQKYQTLFQNLK